MLRNLFILVGLLAWLFAGCQSQEISQCLEPDWYEIGRRSGAEGSSVDYSRPLVKCSESNPENNFKRFVAGRIAGLAEFCQENNGLNLGRANLDYRFVCPSHMETAFLEGYRRGKKIFLLEKTIQSLDLKISQLEGVGPRENQELLRLKSLRSAHRKQVEDLSQYRL